MSPDACLVALEQSAIQTAKCVLSESAAIARKDGIGLYEVAVLSQWQGDAPYHVDGALFEVYTHLARRTLLTSYDCAAFLYPYGISMEEGWIAQPIQRNTALFTVTLHQTTNGTFHYTQSGEQERYRECLITTTPTGCFVKVAHATDYYQIAGKSVGLPTKADARRLVDQVLGFRILQAIPTSERRMVLMQDIHIACHREQVQTLAESYKQEFKENDAVAVIDWGCSLKQEQGFVVLECDGEIDPAFLERLQADEQILDCAIYSVPCTEFGLPPLRYIVERL
jgi:hypothetical protein